MKLMPAMSSKNRCKRKSVDSRASIDDACAMLRQAVTCLQNDDVFTVPLTAPYINFNDDDAPMMSFVSKEDITDLLDRSWVSSPMIHVYIE